ncbi:MAG: DJ-1/PfpI family protein [Dysgonamonadaceae bacterium]|nr:DJ-1/PfpI family protein [Dysgonamonadaceae bacterium]MDD4245525.1 DJ-1/PfpI family protein [Dysgonamonadaceae bacterium]
MKKVVVFLAEGFEEIEAISIIDILRRAEVAVTTVSVTGDQTVKGAHNIPVEADKLFDNVNFADYNMLVLPGGMPGAKNLNEHEGVKSQLKEFAENKFIGAICAAPMVLGNMGLLKGKRATCYPGFEAELIEATVTHEPVTIDGNIITGKGPAFAISFSLQLIETLVGKAARDEVSNGLLV